MDGQVRAANLYLQSLFSTLKREAIKLDQGLLSEAGVAEFVRLKCLTQETLVMVQGVKSNIARAMNSLKMPVRGEAFSAERIAEILDSEGGLKSLRKLAKEIASIDSHRTLAKRLTPSAYERGRDAFM